MLPPPLSIAAASPSQSKATKTKPNSCQIQEQAKISRVIISNATLTTKSEPAQVPHNNHNNSSNNTEGKLARDNSDNIGIINNSSNCNNDNHPGKPSDFGTNDNGKLVYNLGGNCINTKDNPMRVDNNNSPASSISNKPCTANAYCSDDRDCNKATFLPFNTNTVPPIEFAQATPVPDVRSPHSTNNASTILPSDMT